MPFAILGFIRNNWMVIVIAVAMIAIIGYVAYLRITIVNQAAEIAELTTANTILTTNVATLKGSIKVQNDSIDQFALQATESQKRIKTLNTMIASQSTKFETKVQTILAEKPPADCMSTIKYLIDAIPEYAL